jgi:hypothetical protein
MHPATTTRPIVAVRLPQYRPRQLLAWVEGTTNGKARRIEFAYRLVNCVAP